MDPEPQPLLIPLSQPRPWSELEREFAEARQQGERRKKRSAEMRKKHNVQFYDFLDLKRHQYTVDPPATLAGEYDIIFHHARYDDGDDFLYEGAIDNRTTKGTVVLEESPGEDGNQVVSGKLEIHPDLKGTSECSYFQRNVKLTNGVRRDEPGYADIEFQGVRLSLGKPVEPSWRYLLDADFIEEAHEHGPVKSSLHCIRERIPMPWIPDEQFYFESDEEGRSYYVRDESLPITLEQAERLAMLHEKGPAFSSSWLIRHKNFPQELARRVHEFVWYKPKPIFFLEPGDLLWKTMWGYDDRVDEDGFPDPDQLTASSYYILRPRVSSS